MPSVAMDGREIPGFYYDAAKKKYFKIQPNHLASTASQYSRQNVSKARKEAAQVEVENRRKYAESVQRVRRSALVTSQSGLFARRELGRAPNNVLDFEARAIGAGYNNAECIVGGLYPVAALARLPQTDQYVLGASARIYMLGPRQDRAKQFTVSSRITSMSVSDDYMVVTGSAGGMNPASIHFYSENDCQHELSTMPHAIIGAQDDVSHFSSAGNPVAHNSMFLIGSTAGAALVSPEPPDNINPSIHTGSDVLAVDWVNASIAVLGTRNGSIHLWDTRAQGSALRLHHGSCISKLRQLDQNLLVVAGLEHSLAMYDLRMPAIQHLPSRKNKRQHNGSSKKVQHSNRAIIHLRARKERLVVSSNHPR